jgi:hypothetical protein
MTAAHVTHGHDEHAVNPLDLFPAQEWREFHESDKQAASRIVILMLSIFVVGIVLYSIVLGTL